MSHLKDKMQHIRDRSDAVYRDLEKAQQLQVNHAFLLVQHTKTILEHLTDEFLACDKRLFLQEKVSDDPGFVIGYRPMQDWNVKTFTVKANCAADELEVFVSDGHWEQAPNAMGNWADWADERIVYAGGLDEGRLRKAIERHFTKWYERILSQLRQ